MVSIRQIPFLPLLRGLVRSGSRPWWNELMQVLRHGLATQFSVSRNASPSLAWTKQSSEQPPPLFQMATGYWVSQSVYVAAKLAIPDAIGTGLKSCSEIAAAIGANEHSLFRLLRALCSIGICAEKSSKFELTSQGHFLQSDVPGSWRSMVLTLGEIHYRAWGELLYSVKTGRPAFDYVFGMGLFDYLVENGEDGATFNAAMTDFSGLASYAVLLTYDFSAFRSIVDVGGGHGKFLQGILEIYPQTKGTVFDLPAVVEGAIKRLEYLGPRCSSIGGDFFESIPAGADAYILSGVIHDWDDTSSIAILRNCRNAMSENGRILVVEMTVPETKEPSFSTLLDLNMLVMSRGRERTVSEFRNLFQAAGLDVVKIVSTLSPLKIIEGRPDRRSGHAVPLF
jgi:O-methyltransferase domain/Dimerisation domain